MENQAFLVDLYKTVQQALETKSLSSARMKSVNCIVDAVNCLDLHCLVDAVNCLDLQFKLQINPMDPGGNITVPSHQT